MNKQEHSKVGADQFVLLSSDRTSRRVVVVGASAGAARPIVGRVECMLTGVKEVIREVRSFRRLIQLL